MTNIKTAREKSGKKQIECAEAVGVTLRAWQGYEQGIREPKFETLCAIADLFNVTTDYLLGREQPGSQPEPLSMLSAQNHMDEAEELLFEKYLALPQKARDAIIKMMHSLAEELRKSAEAGAQEVVTTTIRLHLNRASAGLGYDLSNHDEWKKITVVKDRCAECADFAVEIEGDSMLPDYKDGDIVYIELDEEVPVGKVGLFRQGDKGYIKERGKDRLISRNSEYPDIFPEDGEIVCIGRVTGTAELVQ